MEGKGRKKKQKGKRSKCQIAVCHKRIRRQKNTHPSNADRILNLCADLHDQDASTLQIKVIRYLSRETFSESGFLLLLSSDDREWFCEVVGERILKPEVRYAVDSSPFYSMISKKRPMYTMDVPVEFREQMEVICNRKIQSMLCAPVLTLDTSEVVAIACLINKRSGEFNEKDVEQIDDLTILLRRIMQEAKNLTKAERCSVFLLEKETDELVAKVFDSGENDRQESRNEIRIPASQGIAGHVATTGREILNIDDAYSHDLFYRGVDESTGFRTRNILCFPIKDENSMIEITILNNGELYIINKTDISDVVVGVAQLCNKINAAGFTANDIEIAQAFSVYCCISIMHVCTEDYQQLTRNQNPSVKEIHPELDSLSFLPRILSENEMAMAFIAMLEDMNFISKFRISKPKLARFVLMVRKGYRDPPYHNWVHAFSVAHFCYVMYKNFGLSNYMDDLDCLALTVAGLCHDIDHRGTTNAYQKHFKTVLATLYSSEGSVMERHHFNQTLCILNSADCNIFENLSSENYERIVELMRDIILATDLGLHLNLVKDQEKMADSGFVKTNKKHQYLLRSLLITCSDLSDQAKCFSNSKTVANLIYNEFFSQGDMEKAQGITPSVQMDRQRANISEDQVNFLDRIALPVFRILGKLFPAAKPLEETVERNRKIWSIVDEGWREMKATANSSIDMFNMDFERVEKQICS
ncbi:DgyrCDS13001 [Dimorphilus gyrociliatus]|uniref:Phosphodiesterase n=1 Tax=Dimorphilus gyrociliatus TaxID=2664684 RepID=A0A7I8W9C3_9ANNE|nr:DgyrCDS13001 [Dimorphilus gyrociliatus]